MCNRLCPPMYDCLYFFHKLNLCILAQAEKREKRRIVRALHTAIEKNDKEKVCSLLQTHSDLDVNFHYGGQSALQLAVIGGHDLLCEILIKYGSDVDKATVEDNTLVNIAAWHGHHEVSITFSIW